MTLLSPLFLARRVGERFLYIESKSEVSVHLHHGFRLAVAGAIAVPYPRSQSPTAHPLTTLAPRPHFLGCRDVLPRRVGDTCTQIQLTLDEHQAMLDAKAKELADMIGEVSIKTVDDSEFAEGAIRNKQEVQEEGYMGGKVRQKERRNCDHGCQSRKRRIEAAHVERGDSIEEESIMGVCAKEGKRKIYVRKRDVGRCVRSGDYFLLPEVEWVARRDVNEIDYVRQSTKALATQPTRGWTHVLHRTQK